MRGLAVGGPLHGQIISSSRPVDVLDQRFPIRWDDDFSTDIRRSTYRPQRLGVPGSSKTVHFWVHDSHSTEAAQAMAWEMLLDDFENTLHRTTRKEVRFP